VRDFIESLGEVDIHGVYLLTLFDAANNSVGEGHQVGDRQALFHESMLEFRNYGLNSWIQFVVQQTF